MRPTASRASAKAAANRQRPEVPPSGARATRPPSRLRPEALTAPVTPNRGWINVEASARRNAVKNLFVDRPVSDQLFGLFDKVRSNRWSLPEPQCIMLTGDTGRGKSSLLKKYLARHPPRRIDGCLAQPVLYVELPSSSTAIGAMKQILIALDDPSRGSGKLNDLIGRACQQISAQKVEIVLADEWQHLTESGPVRLNRAADTIKQVAKATNVPFVMTGMPTAEFIVDQNSQLAGITPYRKRIDAFSYGTIAERNAFRTFLVKVDEALPFSTLAGLADPEIARMLFDTVDGQMRSLMTLIRQAATHAIDRDSQKIEPEDLRHGYDQTPGVNYDNNPF